MTTKLVKETIERTLNDVQEEVENTVSIEYKVLDENENVKGNVHISRNSVSFSIYNSTYDIHDWKLKIEELITNKEEITE